MTTRQSEATRHRSPKSIASQAPTCHDCGARPYPQAVFMLWGRWRCLDCWRKLRDEALPCTGCSTVVFPSRTWPRPTGSFCRQCLIAGLDRPQSEMFV